MNEKIINNIKGLGIDMIQTAGSGHPGIVLGAAPIIYTIYAKHMNINPNDVNWPNRDRFVLSAGHGSALLYATLFMAGYNIDIKDLKAFRHAYSKTPGHPELITPGVEIQTGPLGQGIASAVGMAIASKKLSVKFYLNKKPLINNNVYVLCGDGDLMEGVSYEACSLAGTLNLDNLFILYDSNSISLDGKTDMSFTEDVLKRFKACGFYTALVKNPTVENIDKAIKRAKKVKKPKFIEIRTIIGKDSFNENTNIVHGSALDNEDVKQIKQKLKLSIEAFSYNKEAKEAFTKQINDRSIIKYNEWLKNYQDYTSLNNSNDLHILFSNDVAFSYSNIDFNVKEIKKESGRAINSEVMNLIEEYIPSFIGGSADLASSTKVTLKKYDYMHKNNFNTKNIAFGVREHAMGSIANGLALYNFRPFVSTFLVFADYLKPAMRMSALMNLPVTYIFTHDSIDIGSDGPTHQPIEQLAMLRSIPNFKVYRPADKKEIIAAWQDILNQKNPSALVLSRNEIDYIDTTDINEALKGAYIVRKESNQMHALMIATGSEVKLALDIASDLAKENIDIRVVSMPCKEKFQNQDLAYQESIIPNMAKVIVIEKSSLLGFEEFVYSDKYLIKVDNFGVSGNKDEVLNHFHYTYDEVKDRIKKLIK